VIHCERDEDFLCISFGGDDQLCIWRERQNPSIYVLDKDAQKKL